VGFLSRAQTQTPPGPLCERGTFQKWKISMRDAHIGLPFWPEVAARTGPTAKFGARHGSEGIRGYQSFARQAVSAARLGRVQQEIFIQADALRAAPHRSPRKAVSAGRYCAPEFRFRQLTAQVYKPAFGFSETLCYPFRNGGQGDRRRTTH
jgi:hypothetical protein